MIDTDTHAFLLFLLWDIFISKILYITWIFTFCIILIIKLNNIFLKMIEFNVIMACAKTRTHFSLTIQHKIQSSRKSSHIIDFDKLYSLCL